LRLDINSPTTTGIAFATDTLRLNRRTIANRQFSRYDYGGEKIMAKVSVIVPAAGSGTRFGAKTNKIFARIIDQPVFIRTLEAFSSRDDVCQIQIVVSADDMPEMKERFGGNLGFMGVKLVQGGATRSQSVRNALAGLSADADLVCIHDAVRPCISPLWIDAVF